MNKLYFSTVLAVGVLFVGSQHSGLDARSIKNAKPKTSPPKTSPPKPAKTKAAAPVLQSQIYERRILQSQELTPPQKARALEFLQTVTYPTPEAARKALKIDPNDAEAHRTLADFDGEHSDQFQNEIKERREAIRCYPNNPYDIMSLGSMIRRVDKPEAVRLLSQVANGNFSDDAKKEASGLLATVQAQK